MNAFSSGGIFASRSGRQPLGPAVRGAPVAAVALGDSITSNGGILNTSAAVPTVAFTQKGILAWLEAISQGRIRQLTAGYPGNGQSRIAKIIVLNGGSGYTPATTVTLTARSGSTGNFASFAATPVIVEGRIVGVTITNPASGFSGGPNVVVSDSGGGSGAVLAAVVDGILGFGVSGATSPEIAGRVGDAVAAGARFAFYLAGTNDLPNGATFADTRVAALNVARSCVAAGVTPVIICPLARDQASGLSTIRANQRFTRWCKSVLPALVPGAIVVDANPYLVSPDAGAAQGGVAGNTLTGVLADGIHPTALGAYKVALAIWQQIQALVPQTTFGVDHPYDIYDATYNPTGYLNPNPLIAAGTPNAASAPFTGTKLSALQLVRSGGTGTGTIDGSVETTRTDGLPGSRQVVSVNVTGESDNAVYRAQFGFPTLSIGGANPLQLGDLYEAEVELEATNLANVKGIQFYTTFSSAAGSLVAVANAYWGQGTVAAANFPQGNLGKLLLRHPQIVVPASAVAAFLMLDFTVGAGAASFTAKVARLAARKVL